MQKIQTVAQQINNTTILEKDYQEYINVTKDSTLIIEGQTNRRIDNNGGTVIVKGCADRINSFSGKIVVEENGYVDSLYCLRGEVEIKGSVHELVAKINSVFIKENGHIISFSNEDAKVTIDKNTYIKNYGQWGKNASCNIINEGDRTIQNMVFHCGGKNE